MSNLLHPHKETDPVEISLVGRGEPRRAAISSLFLDAYSGAVLKFVPYAQSSTGNKIYRWAAALCAWTVGAGAGMSHVRCLCHRSRDRAT